MKLAILSYSLTGNNRKLGAAIAAALSSEHIEITTEKPRTMGSIVLDVLFRRTPKVAPVPDLLGQYDKVLFLAPVWMGQVASPLRPYLKELKTRPRPYGFVSISGGALNPNPGLNTEIAKRAGCKPGAFLDLHISELFVTGKKKITAKDTGDYVLTDADVTRLVGLVKESPVWRFCC